MRFNLIVKVMDFWMKRIAFFSIMLLIIFVGLHTIIAQQTFNVTAEALGQANLRATTDVTSNLVGEIAIGTPYPIVGRSELFPWYLLGDPVSGQPIGWVFAELVSINGNINSVPYSTIIIDGTQLPLATPTLLASVQADTDSVETFPTATLQPSATQAFTVAGTVQGEVNVRYGPGINYPRVGVAQAGERFQITGWHSQFPWVQIGYPNSPNGFAWIAIDLLDIQGNIFTLPAIATAQLNLPTLTPTPAVISASAIGDSPAVPLSTGFQVLGNQLWSIVLEGGFDPETSRFGALFVMDLQTGEAITFGSDFAFSGTSVSKIAVLASMYANLDVPPNQTIATDIANMMICSENVATNKVMALAGNGDVYAGAATTTDLFRTVGLENSFITAPYIIPNATPVPPTSPIPLYETEANQEKANVDLSNQVTVDEMGWLLASVYQCGYQESGPLIENFPGQFEPRECRQLIHVMANNNVDALLKAGVPADTRVAHKHGWINDTHGNAAMFFTPGGDYVIVMMLHQPEWLNFEESLPVIAEVSRTVYNYYNPDTPQEFVREGFIPEAGTCNFAGTPLVGDLMQPVWDQ